MKKTAPTEGVCTISTYHRSLTIAFQADVEVFLLKFEKLSSLKFSDFAQVWREMKFSYINSDQQYYSFIRQFVENCFFILKKFIVYPKNIYTETGAFYLMYALYFKQLVKDWVKIRITHFEYTKIQDLMTRLREDKQLEPLFCYAKLVTANAFEYVFQKKPLAPEPRHLKNLTEYCDDTFQVSKQNMRAKLEDKLNQGNFLDKFTKVTNSYNESLAKFAVHNPGLGIFESTILEDVNSAINSSNQSETQQEGHKKDSIYERRMAIKQRAMASRSSSKLGAFKEEPDEVIDEDDND